MKAYYFLVTLLAFSVATPALAQTTLNNQLSDDTKRIQQGEASGQLTKGEANRLDKGEARIQSQEQRDMAKNGGTLTPAEKAKLQSEQKRESADIYKDKHNAKVAPAAAN